MEELNVKGVRYVDPAGGHASVVLDTTITDELRLEWLAREVSRKVNELRKQAGLRVEDRITLLVDADGDVRRAVDAHREWLQAETLAVAIEDRRDAGARGVGRRAGRRTMLAGSTAVAARLRVSRRRIYAVMLGTAAVVAARRPPHQVAGRVASCTWDSRSGRARSSRSTMSRTAAPRSASCLNCTGSTSRSRLVVSLYIVFFGYRYGTTWYRQVLIGMILGGALSNGVDRLVQGSVVDFIDFHFWPVFNVADSCIVVAIVLLLVLSFVPSSHSPTSSASSAPS